VVSGEEGCSFQVMQKRNDLIAIVHSGLAKLNAYLAKMNPPEIELLALAEDDIFIKDVHAARCCFSVCAIRV
jgi:hypothetical protein